MSPHPLLGTFAKPDQSSLRNIFKIHFYIIVPSTTRSHNLFPFYTFYIYTSVCILLHAPARSTCPATLEFYY